MHAWLEGSWPWVPLGDVMGAWPWPQWVHKGVQNGKSGRREETESADLKASWGVGHTGMQSLTKERKQVGDCHDLQCWSWGAALQGAVPETRSTRAPAQCKQSLS